MAARRKVTAFDAFDKSKKTVRELVTEARTTLYEASEEPGEYAREAKTRQAIWLVIRALEELLK